jgi:hypothetical protein
VATGHIHPLPATVGTALVVLASRVPDIDHPNSKPGMHVNRLLPGFPQWLHDTWGTRRSPFHWGTSAVLVGLVHSLVAVQIDPRLWWVGLAIGGSWLLHILADCLTWLGAPLFAPVTMHMIRPRYGRRIECGGVVDRQVIGLISSFAVFCAVLGVLGPMIKAWMNM